MPDVRGATERALIVEDVKRVMTQHASRLVGNRSAANSRRAPRVPYLADRTTQEEAVEIALEGVNREGGVRPFFIVGPENECVDEFLQRLEEDTSRRCLGGVTCWEAVEVEWPGDETGDSFAQTFARRTAVRLGQGGRVSADDLARLLTARRRPVALLSRLLARDWKEDETARVRSWLDLWRRVAAAQGHRAVLPVLRIKMPPAKPGWIGVPGGGWFDGVGRRNKVIWDALGELKTEYADLDIGLPAILSPLPEKDIDIWKGKHFSLDDSDRAPALQAITNLLSLRDHKQGVPHADFAAAMLPFFRGAVV
jgi:hypothetical protein